MFCKNCGKEVEENAAFCPHCGAKLDESAPNPPQWQPAPTTSPQQTDAPSMGFAVLGFFFPIVGLIIWLCMMNTTPLRAKSAGKGALTGVIVQVVLWMLTVGLAFCAAAAA